jgi:hypothetical protein
MRIQLLVALLIVLGMSAAAPSLKAQGVKTGPDASMSRDPFEEKDSLHNLEVARNYFRLKKAYVAALSRCEEIIEGNPNFTKIEEVLLMAAQSSLWLAEGKGKQVPTLYFTFEGGVKRALTSDEFREKGRAYLNRLLNEFPDSTYRRRAAEELRVLDSPKPAKTQ